MKTYRLLHIRFKTLSTLYAIHQWQLDHNLVLTQHCIQIMYTQSPIFQMQLYGFDEQLKWSSRHVSDLDQVNHECRKMSMTCDPKTRMRNSHNPCGLASLPSTSHCFHDDTHHTCCLLGGEARRYANATGNPIGRASEQAFFETFGFYPDAKTLTPWCTCIGSEACTFYAKRFHDGTHIKYIDSPTLGRVLHRDESQYKVRTHRTPGVG